MYGIKRSGASRVAARTRQESARVAADFDKYSTIAAAIIGAFFGLLLGLGW